MSMLIYLIPVALFLGALALVSFLWAVKSGQYDDLDGAAERVLLAEAEAPLRDETRNAPSADHPRSANEKEGKKS